MPGSSGFRARKLSLSNGGDDSPAVLLASLLVAMLTALLRSAGGWRSGGDGQASSPRPWLSGRLRQDPRACISSWEILSAAGVVLIALLVIEVFILGSRGRLETGWTALGLAFAGAAVAELWKIGLTGKHLTSLEAFQDVLATGLLATSASSLAILQAPASWSELVLLSQTVAAATMLVYHAANAYRVASSGKHLGAAAAALIVGTPYVVGGLVLLESAGLMQSLGTGLTLGLLEAQPGGPGIPRTGVRSLLLQRGRGSGAWPGNERFAPEVSPCACRDAGRRDCGRCGLLDRGSRVGSDRGRLAHGSAAARGRADDRSLAGRTVGGGLPDHRDAHGRDPWTGTVGRLGNQPSRHGDEEGDGLQRGFHG